MEVLAIAFKARSDVRPHKLSNGRKYLLDQYADELTMYLERAKSHIQNSKNISAVLDTLEEFRILSGLKVNKSKKMLTIFEY